MGNFASLPSATSVLLIFGAYPADRTAAPNGHRPPYRPLDGDIVAEITPRIFAVCSEGQDCADSADHADGCVPLADSQFVGSTR